MFYNVMRSEANISFFLSLLLTSLFIMGCGLRSSDFVREYNDFGVKCAKMGLWDEAIMRWNRVTEIDPKNAQAHNNLGVAYESKGNLEAAMVEYKTAVELDPGSKIYKSNYSKFRQNYERVRKGKDTERKIDIQESEMGPSADDE
jgi:tetratricopeptide (TPR) repeat protein